ncbi:MULTISPECIES: DNA polymerase III subunit beta [Persicobacter]|uniref:Beta sliding clamp n=1 Tax=Persicobacter diffluens TaxID=981 RepID=A0AAN4W0D4_9BACT|nr:DNA polymerase III subunit beta [Persicobacter sp. CCB-QB2]GJM61625.1 DNA polymerase III subunit beta [Persicobacter diffluens]
MKFIVSSSSLLKQLSKIHGVVTTNPVVPILENFLFEVDGAAGKLTVTASDLQSSMITEIEVNAEESGSIAIPAKILLDTLKNLPEQPVTIAVDEETYSIEIISENGHYKLSGENATDFPKIPVVENGHSIELSGDAMSRAINNTIFAAGTDDLRPAMTGVFVNLEEDEATFVATDGHRLVRYRKKEVEGASGASIIIPRKALNLLKSNLPADESPVAIEFNDTNAHFAFENLRLISRLIDERFPDYENVIPLDNTNEMTINRMQILSTLKRLAIYANKTTNQVRLSLKGTELSVHAEDLDFSNEANETLSCEHEGEDIDIGFNAKFLIEMLNNLNSTEVTFQFSQPNRAGLIIPSDQDEDEDLLMLVMPVMLNQYY